MPTYQYVCTSCRHQLEEFQPITEAPLTHCPACNAETLTRIMGTGVGLIFKGSGFYLTDYKNKKSSAAEGAQKSSDAPTSSDTTKSSDAAKSPDTQKPAPPKATPSKDTGTGGSSGPEKK